MSGPDPERHAAVGSLIAAAPLQPMLQRLADLAVQVLDVQAAQLSLLADVQTAVVVSGPGADPQGTQLPLEESLCRLALTTAPAPLVVPDAARDPRVADVRSVAAGEVGSYLGIPVTAGGGSPVGALCVYGPSPRHWSDRDVAVLQLLSEAVAGELRSAALGVEAERRQVRWALAIEAADISSFDWDVDRDELVLDARLQSLFGWDPGTFPGTLSALTERLHPDDGERFAGELRAAVASGDGFEHEYRVQLPSGELRWVQTRGRAVPDDRGRPARLVGIAHDTTRQRQGDARLARVLESMPAAFLSVDHDWRFSYVNGEAERLLGATRDELVGRVLWELFPELVGSAAEAHHRAAMTSGQPVTFTTYAPPLDSWHEVRVWPTAEGLSVYVTDVTERHRTEEARRLDARRLALVARVSDALSAAAVDRRGGPGALQELLRAVVPELGDWVIASLVGEDGRLHAGASWHADPGLRPVTEQYARVRLGALRAAAPIVDALASGDVVVVPDAAVAAGHSMRAGEAEDAYATLDPGSAVALAFVARGRVLGALTLYRGRDREPMDPGERATLREVADRAALALDSAAVHEQQRRMVEELQRSLLTDPPEPDHSQIAVRYVPAVQAAQVGGDWYDAFLQPGGATVLAIGDVVGHDTVAAAAMGQLRSLLRGIAYSGGGGPAAVLSALDRAMAGLQVHTLATAAVARLEQDEGDRERGQTRLRWSSAGHPPLLVLRPDGRVEVLATPRADLLLGVEPTVRRREQVTVLEPGCTVLLYTDGLVEGPQLPLDDGVDRLVGLLGELGGLPLEELCDQVLSRMRPQGSEDDVALVAVRLHREARPRPAGAGPEVVPPTR